MKGKHSLFHIGIPKSGTTSVQSTLNNDDRLLITRSRYFTSKDWWNEEYPEYPSNKIVVESNETLVSGGFRKVKFIEIVRRMHHINPHANILLTIRKQESALLSMYKYHIKFGHRGVKSLSHWAQNTELGIDYLSICMYESVIKALLGYFPRDQLHVMPFEWLVENPGEFYEHLYTIIGLPFRESAAQKQALNVMRFDERELFALVKLSKFSFKKDSILHTLEMKFKRRLSTLLKMKPPTDFFEISRMDGYEKVKEEFARSNRYIIDNGFVSEEMMTKFGYNL